LTTRRDILRSQGIDVRVVIRSGEPDDEILKEIEENDYSLVAMATHGHSFIGDILFGSVSRTLKHRINVPLLLVRAGC
jgi:nucleotide-binding universal stress UspA family protein